VFHLLTHLNLSIAYALTKNKRLLAEESPSFRDICLSISTGTFCLFSKGPSKAYKLQDEDSCPSGPSREVEYNINKMMRQQKSLELIL
jgi:hypothetical protein